MSVNEYKLITDRVGLLGGIALLMGTAVGMSIFLVPTQMGAEAGPSITLAILVCFIPMTFGILQLLQLGGALPVAGGNYVYGSRLIGPFWGLVAIAVPIIAIWAYLLFAAFGFADFLPVFFESIGITLSMPEALDSIGVTREIAELAAVWGLLGAFILLNYNGIQMVTNVQIGLVVLIVLGMLTFIVGAAFSIDPDNFTPFFPDGAGEPFEDGIDPFFTAIVALYIPLQGFAMIIEIGEELESPVKNIPRVLAIGMALVALLTVAVVVALVGAIPWEQLTAGEAQDGGPVGGIAGAAQEILPAWAVGFVAFTALVAAATTVNTLITSYSRTIMRAARDQIVPDYFAAIHGENGTPHRSIVLLGLPPMLVAPLAYPFEAAVLNVDVLDWLVVVTVTGVFIGFMIGGVALWRLPSVFPNRYEHSFYKLPLPLLKVVGAGNVVISAVFLVMIGLSTAPSALPAVFGWIAFAALVYFYRVRKFEKRGIDLKAQMSLLHRHEQVDAGDD